MAELAGMDSNNFPGNVGAGEREARLASGLVARRHFRMAHGVGRSGDIAAVQPKAAGSTVVAKVAASMTLDLLHMAGLQRAARCLLLPVATGMAIVLTLLALRARRPAARYVLWPRVDQKSCLKAIQAAGSTPVFVRVLFCALTGWRLPP
jgi:O-phospho-L-seryl-tRNASec:L-selenocysteinyl-tRNA synthase